MRTRILALALLSVAPLACERMQAISFDRFVDTTVELRRASAAVKTPAEFQAQKQAIEKRLGVTDADLDAFTRAHQGDVKYMSAVWDSVESRLEKLAQADARKAGLSPDPADHPPGPGAPPPPGGIPSGKMP